MQYMNTSNTYNLDFFLSSLEKSLFRDFEDMLDNQGFYYLSLPAFIKKETLLKQEVVGLDAAFSITDGIVLNGSAEQGILEYFENKTVGRLKLYSFTHCYRNEKEIEPLIRLWEFKKLEQFCFTDESHWEEDFMCLLTNATKFLEKYGIVYRVSDVTKRDPGYHIKKWDIEIYLKSQNRWLEANSCSYFGQEQTRRFNITGATHSISNTGIASPRILLGFIERYNEQRI